jgi:hypothetical protein
VFSSEGQGQSDRRARRANVADSRVGTLGTSLPCTASPFSSAHALTSYCPHPCAPTSRPCLPPCTPQFEGVTGFKDTNKVLALSRIMVGWMPVGMAMGAYDMAARCARGGGWGWTSKAARERTRALRRPRSSHADFAETAGILCHPKSEGSRPSQLNVAAPGAVTTLQPTNLVVMRFFPPSKGTCGSASSLARPWRRSSWCRSAWHACWATFR